jgi:hypothetical protein
MSRHEQPIPVSGGICFCNCSFQNIIYPQNALVKENFEPSDRSPAHGLRKLGGAHLGEWIGIHTFRTGAATTLQNKF